MLNKKNLDINQIDNDQIKDVIKSVDDIEQEDKKDDHLVRKAGKKFVEQLFNHLPFFTKFMLWAIIGIPSIFVVWCYIFHISSNENKLEKIITNTLWTLLTSMAVLGLPHVKAFFKK